MAEEIQIQHQSFFSDNPEMHTALNEYKRFRDLGGVSLVLFTHFMEARIPLLVAAKKHEKPNITLLEETQPATTSLG